MRPLVTDHIGTELEENLGAIEEVRGYVKIVRSYALLSLRFLKSLTIIGGERLYDSVWVLYHQLVSANYWCRRYFRQQSRGFVIVLSVCLSFCKQDNWRMRKRMSGWPSRSVLFLLVIRIHLWIFGSLFHFLHHCGIGDFCKFVSISRTVNGQFVPYWVKWLTPTR